MNAKGCVQRVILARHFLQQIFGTMSGSFEVINGDSGMSLLQLLRIEL